MSAGTGWSDDADDLELATVYMKPVLTAQSQVTGFTASGANNTRDGETTRSRCTPSATRP